MHPDTVRCHLLAIAIATQNRQQIEAKDLKEYPADWLKNANTVVRDASGRFASKASDTAQSIEESTSGVKEKLDDLMKESKYKIHKKFIETAAEQIEKYQEKYPETAEKLAKQMFGKTADEIREDLAQEYSKVSSEMKEAIEENPFEELKDDLSRIGKGATPEEVGEDLLKSLEYVGYKYNETIDGLNNLEGSPAMQAAGKAAAIAIPAGIFLAAFLGPEIVVGLAMDLTIPDMFTARVSSFIAEVATEKILEEKVENPWVRTGISLAAGMLVGRIASAGMEKAFPVFEKKAIAGLKQAKEKYQAWRYLRNAEKYNTIEALESSPSQLSGMLDDLVEGSLDKAVKTLKGMDTGFRTMIKKNFKKLAVHAKKLQKSKSIEARRSYKKLIGHLKAEKDVDELIASGSQAKIAKERGRLYQAFTNELDEVRWEHPGAEDLIDMTDVRAKIARLETAGSDITVPEKKLLDRLKKLADNHLTFEKLSGHLQNHSGPVGAIERNVSKMKLLALQKLDNLPRKLKLFALRKAKRLPANVWRKFMFQMKRLPDTAIAAALSAIAVQWNSLSKQMSVDEAISETNKRMDEILDKFSKKEAEETENPPT